MQPIPFLPANHHAPVIESPSASLKLRTFNTPSPTPRKRLNRIPSSPILPYHGAIYDGTRPNPIPTPIVGGLNFIGSVGIDERVVPGERLVRGVCESPAKNCFVLEEGRLCSTPGLGLGYAVQDLAYMASLLVPFGGLRDISVSPGETIVIFPVTGFYASLGVHISVAMGCRVIAMGRDETELNKLKDDITRASPRVIGSIESVVITGDIKCDGPSLQKFGAIDAVLDITPTGAKGVSLMGSTAGIAVAEIMVNDIMLRGKYMYDRETIVRFIKMLERGIIPLGQSSMDTKAITLE
ncbi:hypothetical protein BDV06DRAFT_214441 [Aspergillus oleicola]